MNKDIFLTNSLGNTKDKFTPINPKKIGMYVCGPTVYDNPHIGNARPLVVFDILFKILKCKYGNNSVNYVRNITDIDDKIIMSSIEKKISIDELTKKITNIFHDDCKYLSCENPTQEPKATENISLMIEMINKLIKNGYAYLNKGNVYFEVKKFKDYGKLSNKNLEELIAGSRVEISENKKNPEDFVLWKPSIDNEPYWDSPWGKGRPGWHLECSVMSKKYLGVKFDIHGGGRDLIFPHHENEIAQSESYTGIEPFARYWMHNGTLGYGEEKMSKSLGNVFSIGEALKVFSPDAIRMFFLSSHYRTPLVFSSESVKGQQRAIERLKSAVTSNSGEGEVLKTSSYREKFEAAMDEDFNTPIAFSVIFDLARDINRESSNGLNVASAQDLLSELVKVLGITLETDNSKSDGDIAPYLDLLLEVREGLRNKKQFELSDQIRDRLVELGVSIEDTSAGARWKLE